MTNLHFCESCNKLRLTCDGKLRPCLGSYLEFDIMKPLRAGASDEELRQFFLEVVERALLQRLLQLLIILVRGARADLVPARAEAAFQHRHDAAEMRQVGRNIDRKTVERDPAADSQAERGDLRARRADGVDATCETCPHYLLLTATDMDLEIVESVAAGFGVSIAHDGRVPLLVGDLDAGDCQAFAALLDRRGRPGRFRPVFRRRGGQRAARAAGRLPAQGGDGRH